MKDMYVQEELGVLLPYPFHVFCIPVQIDGSFYVITMKNYDGYEFYQVCKTIDEAQSFCKTSKRALVGVSLYHTSFHERLAYISFVYTELKIYTIHKSIAAIVAWFECLCENKKRKEFVKVFDSVRITAEMYHYDNSTYEEFDSLDKLETYQKTTGLRYMTLYIGESASCFNFASIVMDKKGRYVFSTQRSIKSTPEVKGMYYLFMNRKKEEQQR